MKFRLKDNQENVQDYEKRFRVVYFTIFLFTSILFFRLFFLQVIEGTKYRQFSQKNRIKKNYLMAPRGMIYDRNKKVLVDNIPELNVYISPQYATQLKSTAAAISPILDIPVDTIIKKVKKSRRRNGPFLPVKIKSQLSIPEAYHLKKLRFEHLGLIVKPTVNRFYPLREMSSQVLGYVGEASKQQIKKHNERKKEKGPIKQGDIIGKRGVERVLDNKLRGIDGLSYVEVDAHGRESSISTFQSLGLEEAPPLIGNHVTLTLDKDIQIAAFKAMMREDSIGPRKGSVIAMKSNGEILAWVNSPTYDPNDFTHGVSKKVWKSLLNDPFKPLLNKAIQDRFSPGSTFKPVVALAALQEDIISENTRIHSPSYLRFGRRNYHDHSQSGHGYVSVLEALERSSNVFFYKMGIRLGIDNIAKYAQALGFGKKTGIILPNETRGTMPTSEWKLKKFGEKWQPGENLVVAIGQGFVNNNTLQLALAYNTIGLEGKKYKPFLIKEISDSKGNPLKTFSPTLEYDLTDKESAPVYIKHSAFKAVKKGLWLVSNGPRGTARRYKLDGIDIAGKTGTSQVRSFSADQIYKKCEQRILKNRHNGWFVGYAPADNPEITVAVLTQHSCHGSSGSAPIVRDIMQAYFEKYPLKQQKTKETTTNEVQ